MEDTNINNETNNEQLGSEPEVKTYSQEEVDKLLQSEVDRRITGALKKQAERFEKEKAEAEKLKEMDEAQRKEYEFTKRVEEFEAKEKEFTLMQNKLSASKVMADRGLPVNFVDYIVAEDAEAMMDNINAFERSWKAAINDAVSSRLANGTQPSGKTKAQTGLTKEEFQKMTIGQQSELYRTNPELYKQLTQM